MSNNLPVAMHPVNFRTPNLVIGCYPAGAGGKFLFNSIGVSSHGVLQDRDLAQQQLAGTLTSQDKKQLILNRVNDNKSAWDDLGLGCGQYFGVGEIHYFSIQNPNLYNFYPHVEQVTNQTDWKFCLASHSKGSVRRYVEVWPNAFVLFVNNSDRFIRTYRPRYLYNELLWKFWLDVRADSWPQLPPRSWEQYKELPEHIHQDMATLFNNDIALFLKHEADFELEQQLEQKIIQDISATSPHSHWDCDWFFDKEQTINGVELLYQQLQLPDFDREFTGQYYDSWIGTLDRLTGSYFK